MESKNMDILSIQDRAKKRREKGFSVINGSAGMLYRDNKELCTFHEINEALKKETTSYLAYPNPIGSEKYRKEVLSFLFEEDLPEIEKKYDIPFSCTLGGTGAIAMAMYEETLRNGFLLLSDLSWPNYVNMAEIHHLPIEKYSRFEEGSFSFKNLKAALDEGLSQYPHCLFILNDPCQNPSGYCFSEEEYHTLFDLLSSYEGKVTFFLDLAYSEYAPMGFLFRKILKERELPVETFLGFSASKCFGLYGLRLGAIFGLLKKGSDVSFWENHFYALARGTYSCPNNGAMGPVSDVLENEERRKALKKEIQIERDRLFHIGKHMSTVLDQVGIKHIPYGGGFYITLFMDHATEFCLKCEEHDVYIVPIEDKYIRIAVSGLNDDEVERIGKAFQAIQQEK